MATKQDLEEKLESLEKMFFDMIEGFKRLSGENNQNLVFLQEMKNELEGVKVDIANMKSGRNQVDYGTKIEKHQ